MRGGLRADRLHIVDNDLSNKIPTPVGISACEDMCRTLEKVFQFDDVDREKN